MTAVTSPDPSGPTVAAVVKEIATILRSENFPTGERALLRRMDPRRPQEAMLPLARLLLRTGSSHSAREWMLVIHFLVLIRGAHREDQETGATLHAIGLSEGRLNMLLAADLDILFDLLPRLARRIGAGGQAIDVVPIARLALNADRNEPAADRARLDIARGYARAAGKAAPQTEKA